ncbi:hypothetical protein J3A64_003348 [Pseudarthrobacter sp. PvP004]|jgi:hypothetical protein|nr:hypothetical protein [Pseudarthrobacter sp. PvP004]
MNRNAAEKGNGAVRGSTTWALDRCFDLRKRDAELGELFSATAFLILHGECPALSEGFEPQTSTRIASLIADTFPPLRTLMSSKRK